MSGETIDPATTFSSIQYVDPFAPLPLASTQAGVTANLNTTGVTGGYVAYARLLENNLPIGYGTGSTANTVRVLNAMPLAAGPSYIIQVQFGGSGQNPADLDWSNTANIASAPVVTQQARVRVLSVLASSIDFTWEIPSGAQIGGIYLQLIDDSSGSLTGDYYLGSDAEATIANLSLDPQQTYSVRISAVQPVVGATAGGFSAPFTTGPVSAQQIVPTASPAISAIRFDGGQASAVWSLPALPTGEVVAAPRYEILLMSGTDTVAAAEAGDKGGQLVTGALDTLSSPAIAGRVIYGAFVGPPGAAVAIEPQPPQIVDATVTLASGKNTIAATFVTPGALSTDRELSAVLYTNGVAGTAKTATASPAAITWDNITPAGNTVYEIEATIINTTGGKTSQGPNSQRLTVPLGAAQIRSASYDGKTITIDVDFDPGCPVDGYTVTLDNGGTPATVSAGPTMPISIPYDLDLSKTWTATVTPVMGIITGVVSAGEAITLPTIAAPVLKSVIYDGSVLHLQWTAAVLPYLTGYQVTVTPSSGSPIVLSAGPETSLSFPLDPATAVGATVALVGVSPLRNTAASTAVNILTDAVEMGAVSVSGSTVTAAWTVPGSPTVQAELLTGDTATSVLANASTTGVSFAVPSDTSQPYRLQARMVSTDGVAMGPVSARADLLLTAPQLLSGRLGEGRADLVWELGGPFAADSFVVTATPTSGSAASLTVAGSAYDGPAPDAFFEAGALTIAARNAFCTGPAVSVPIKGAAVVTGGDYEDGTLSVNVTLGTETSGDIYWLDVLADGGLLAREVFTATGTAFTQPFTIDVGVPDGANVAVVMAGVGPKSLTPASARMSVPSGVPVLDEAAYEGTKLHVNWQPGPGPGIGGYLVSVAGGSPAIADTFVAGGDSEMATIDVGASISYPFGAGVAVSVRAASGKTSGAASVSGEPGASRPPVLAGYAYGAGVPAAGDPPYVFRRGAYQALADVHGNAIELYLPSPFTTGTPTVPSSASPTFKLEPAPSGSTLPYKLTLSDDVWTTLGSSGVRAALRTDYVSFLNDVEDTGVFPWAIALIRQIIAQAMPQTFEEVLYYRYGLWRDDSIRVADLTPGTRLQLSNALYQAVVGGSSEKNGFLALGTEMFDLADVIPQGGGGALATGAARSLSVDAFLSLVYPGGGNANNGRPVAAGAIDFFDDQNRQAYYRLFYPAQFTGSGSNGSTSLTSNVTLIGTTSWKTLSTITDQYASTGTFPTGTDYFATYFRGRSAVTPLVAFAVQGENRWAPLGTTVRQALATQGLAAFAGGESGSALTMSRATANLFAYPVAAPGLSLDPVDLTDTALGGVVPSMWPLDMPVVGGDQVSLRQS
ncbi:MAG: hypothetical protein ACN6I5_04910 [Hyphomicrobiales bacterium]